MLGECDLGCPGNKVLLDRLRCLNKTEARIEEGIREMFDDSRQCPLCDQQAGFRQSDPSRDAINIECERCGRFRITYQALTGLKPEQKAGLSAFCRRAGRGSDLITILSTNVESMLASLPKYTPPEKLDNLLQLIADMSPSPAGAGTLFNSNRDYPLLIACGPEEVQYLLSVLVNRGLVLNQPGKMSVTMAGWERLDEVRRKGRTSTRAFVAMWFTDLMNDVYDNAIAPAIRDAGYDPLRIDRFEHVNRIDDEIIGQIKRCRFMVADFTGQRHGVYFEAGMMLGLGRTVIWMCDEESLENKDNGLHFDVRQFNFIVYGSVEEARKRLHERILAIEGEGQLKPDR